MACVPSSSLSPPLEPQLRVYTFQKCREPPFLPSSGDTVVPLGGARVARQQRACRALALVLKPSFWSVQLFRIRPAARMGGSGGLGSGGGRAGQVAEEDLSPGVGGAAGGATGEASGGDGVGRRRYSVCMGASAGECWV